MIKKACQWTLYPAASVYLKSPYEFQDKVSTALIIPFNFHINILQQVQLKTKRKHMASLMTLYVSIM
jgi:hypothetical protein